MKLLAIIAIIYAALGWVCEAQEMPVKRPTMTTFDWSLVGGQFAAHALDYAATEYGLSQPVKWRGDRWYAWQENEIPGITKSKVGFAVYSFGIAGAESVAQIELTRKGHRKMAMVMSEVTIGVTVGTAANNWRTANKTLY